MLDKEFSDKLKSIFNQYKIEDCNSYACWDCEKDLGDLKFDLEFKKKLPLSLTGKLMVICSDCVDNDEEY